MYLLITSSPWLRLLELLVLLDMHLGSSHCLLPVDLSFSRPAQHDGSLSPFQPEAKHKCCSCPSATLAKFPGLLSHPRLFPEGLSELQVKTLLQGSAFFSVTLRAAVASADTLFPPGPRRPITNSMRGPPCAAGGKKYVSNVISQVPFQPSPFPPI